MPTGTGQLKVLPWISAALCLFGFAIICHSQDESGFINLDCGLREGLYYWHHATGLNYSADADFIDTGEIGEISRDYMSDSLDQQLWTLRKFPYGQRNCYNLTAGAGEVKGNKYLIRATFMYGNYDSKNQIPSFDLHLGVEFWTKIAPNSSTSVVREEIIHVPSSKFLYVCLVNTGSGTPFISVLELRPLDQNVYPTESNTSLAMFFRKNFAPTDDEIIRDEVFDRIWEPFPTPPYWTVLKTTETIHEDDGNSYRPPSDVMRTAVTPANWSLPLEFYWTPQDPTDQFYVYLHFAEVQKLSSGQSRQFNIWLGNELRYSFETPSYLSTDTIYYSSGKSKVSFNYSLVKTYNSTLPPSINAVEAYMVKLFLQSLTNENDVLAMANIKSSYGVKRSNWQGDPCLPKTYMWEGVDCILFDDKTIPPRIKFLNLSSSGLTGNVSLYLSNLTSLEHLDMSYNSLTGLVPDFLSELPSLKVLNLTGNNFFGTTPQKLLDKSKNGLLLLRMDDYFIESPSACPSGQCKSSRREKFVVPLSVTLVSVSSILLTALIIFWPLRWRKHRGMGAKSSRNDGMLELKSRRFKYSEILEITDNFESVLGKGGFGTVYRGSIDSTQVAVKVLSQSSMQGYLEFQTEAELLTRVHHRNLTALVGYCYEDTNMALVYEYMANGNLRGLLSDNTHVLSWLHRLQIAIDAAQGLDYLHNGCKPPIIHRDIKSTNILLNEIFEAKLSDFGLSRAFSVEDGSFISTRVIGTPGYLDPEYYETRRLHEKSDIYSLGIVILELITGRQVIRINQDKQHIVQWSSFLVATGDIGKIVDPRLEGEFDGNGAWKALEVAMNCASPTSFRRPTLAHVLTKLTECFEAEKARKEGLQNSEDFLEANTDVLHIEIGSR